MATVIRTRLVDFSHYQSLITLAFIKANNVKGVAAKCTEGTGFVDPHYASNHSRARSYGVAFWAYHFARPSGNGATQAAYFLAHAGLKAGDGILLDLEASSLGQAATRAWRDQFLAYCRARRPGAPIHAYLGAGYCANGTGKDLVKVADELWFPHYTVHGWPSSWSPGYTAAMRANTGMLLGVWQAAQDPDYDHDVSYKPISELIGGAVALTQADIDKVVAGVVAKVPPAVWAHKVAPPTGYGYKNPSYRADDFLSGADAHAKKNVSGIAALAKAIAAVAAKLGAPVDTKAIADAVIASLDPDAIGAAVAASVQASGVVDEQAIAAAVADELGKRIEA